MKVKKSKTKFISGNEAAAIAAMLARVQVIPGYPITPATTVIEKMAELVASGQLNAKFIPVESEHSAMAACIGAAMTGVRTFTATSSQGLLLMNEMLHWAAGARLPIVMVNANRATCAPWALWADQNDSMSVKDSGWIQLYCRNAQEILDTILIAYRLSEEFMIPVMVCYEGFLVSHAYEGVLIPDQALVDRFLPPRKPAFKLDPKGPHSFGNMMLSGDYAETRYNLHKDLLRVPEECKKLTDEFEKLFGRRCEMIMETTNISYDNETLVVTMGTIADTVREVLTQDNSVALLRLKMFRPFPMKVLREALTYSGFKRIVVIDRNLSPGQGGHLWTEIRSLEKEKPVFGYVAGLNGGNITPEVIKEILKDAHRKNSIDAEDPILWR